MIEEKKIAPPSLPTLNDQARVWIYQIDRSLSDTESAELRNLSQDFVNQWHAHENKLMASFGHYFNRFLCLFVDESGYEASGCSIDASVRFVKDLERHFGASFTNRTSVAYLDEKDILQTTEMHALATLKSEGKIDENTLVFNNLVKTAGEMKSRWIVPIKESWQARFL